MITIKKELDDLIDKQVELLKMNGLKNANGSKFKWYLKNFGYWIFANEYSLFLKVNNDKNLSVYKKDCAKSDYLISIFNMDRSISNRLFSEICNIERKFSAIICSKILSYYCDKSDKHKKGYILSLSNDEILEMFPGLKKFSMIPKNNSDEYPFKKDKKIDTDKNILEFKKLLTKFLDYGIAKEANNMNILELSNKWSFGILIKIYSVLPKKIKKEIAYSFLRKDQEIYEDFHIHFEKVMILINHLRNSICHNNVVYTFSYEAHAEKISLFCEKILHIKTNKKFIRIFDIVNIINYLNPHNSNILMLFDKELSKLNKSIDDKISNDILTYMNYVRINV